MATKKRKTFAEIMAEQKAAAPATSSSSSSSSSSSYVVDDDDDDDDNGGCNTGFVDDNDGDDDGSWLDDADSDGSWTSWDTMELDPTWIPPPLPITPSREQTVVVDDYVKGFCVKILALAGATKSTTLMLCARAKPNEKHIIITYNKLLQTELEKRVKDWGLQNVKVMTYHSAVGRAYGCVIRNDTKFIRALQSEPCDLHLFSKFTLLWDECQDMSPLSYNLASMLLSVAKMKATIVVGDTLQSINGYMGARPEFLQNCTTLPGFACTTASGDPRPWVTHTLRTSFRLTPPMATFVNRYVLGRNLIVGGGRMTETKRPLFHDVLKPKSASSFVAPSESVLKIQRSQWFSTIGDATVLYLCPPFMQRKDAIDQVVRRAAEVYGGWGNVAILVPVGKYLESTNPKHPLAGLLRENWHDIPIAKRKEGEMMDFKVNADKLNICTWHSMKGCERPCIIALGWDESYMRYGSSHGSDWGPRPDLPPIAYVTPTRAQQKLIVVADPQQTFRTISVPALLKDSNVVVSHPYSLKPYSASTTSRIMPSITKPKPKPGSFDPAEFLSTYQAAAAASSSGSSSLSSGGVKELKLQKQVRDLLRHMDPTTMSQMKQCVRVVDRRSVSVPITTASTVTTEEGEDNEVESSTKKQKQSGSLQVTVRFKKPSKSSSSSSSSSSRAPLSDADYYWQPVGSLYNCIMPRLVEVAQKGDTDFALRSAVPTVVATPTKASVDSPDHTIEVTFEHPDGRLERYKQRTMTPQVYASYPRTFWPEVKTAAETQATKRTPKQWVLLAVADNAMRLDEHWTARQIANYNWIDTSFIDSVRTCMLEAMRDCNHEKSTYGLPVYCSISNVDLFETLDYVDVVESKDGKGDECKEMWHFRCADEHTDEDLLYLGCCMAVGNITRGHLYMVLGGSILTVELAEALDPRAILRHALNKFQPKTYGPLLTDVANWNLENKINWKRAPAPLPSPPSSSSSSAPQSSLSSSSLSSTSPSLSSATSTVVPS